MDEPSTSKTAICKVTLDETNAKGQKNSPTDRNRKKNDKASTSPRNPEKNPVSSGLGLDYQVQWLMKFVFWAIVKQKHEQVEYTYVRLGTKVTAAGMFDSLVFECTEAENGARQGLMLQCKHTTKKGSQIKFEHLFVGNRGDFSLVKYFLSYIELMRSKLYTNGYHKDLFIVTNYKFDTRELEHKNIVIVLSPNAIWDSLMGDKKGNCYKFSSEKGDLIRLLKEKKELKELKDKLVSEVVREVIDSYLKNKLMSHEKGIFKIYHVYLATEVFDIKTKKFKDALLKAGRNENEIGQRILAGIERETNCLINRENVNANKKFNNSETGLEFSLGFGEGKDATENFINNALREFFDCLIFAVVQPDVEELSKMMQDDLKRHCDRGLERNKDMYLRLESEIKTFYQDTEKAFLSFDEAESIIGSIKPAQIVFNLSPVQKSFTGRIYELEKIHEALQKSKTVISGMGGVGKTELARKFAHEYEKEYDLIVWFDAEVLSKIEETFSMLAEKELKISLTNFDDTKKRISSILEEVYKFLDNRNCLFIYDNVMNLNADNKDIQRFLPKTAMSVHILITSQDCKWGDFEVIKLQELIETEAIEFVKKELKIEEDPQMIELTKKLQCFPLALQQATAYIRSAQEQEKKVDSQFTINHYLELLKESQCSEKLLAYEFSDDSSNTYTKTTLTTWGMAIDRTEADKDCGSLAIKILNISAYLDPDKIPTGIFIHLNDDRFKVGRAIELLKKYSLVTFGEFLFLSSRKKTATISVHRLVQFYVRLHPVWKIQEHKTLVETARVLTKSIYFENFWEEFNYLHYLIKFLVFLEQHLGKDPEACQKLKENDLFLSVALEIIKTRHDKCNASAVKCIKKIYNVNDIRVATVLREAGRRTIIKSDRYEYLRESINISKKNKTTEDVAAGLMAFSSFYDEYSESRLHYLEKSLELKTQAFVVLKNCNSNHEYLAEIKEQYTKTCKELRRWLCDKPFNESPQRLDYFIESQMYFKLIRQSKHENLLRRYLPEFQKRYGPKDDRTADLLFDIGTIESVKNVEFLERALKIYSNRYGVEYFKVIRAYKALSLKYVLRGNYKKAHEFQVKACEASEQNHAECFEILKELKEVFLGLKLNIFHIEPTPTSGEDIELGDMLDRFELNVQLVKFLTGPQELKELKGRVVNVFNSIDKLNVRELLKKTLEVRIKECGYRHKIVFAALYALCSAHENAARSGNIEGINGMFTKCVCLLERASNVFNKRYGLEMASSVKVEENASEPFAELNKRFCDLSRWHSACIFSWKLIRCGFRSNIDEIESLSQFAIMAKLGGFEIKFDSDPTIKKQQKQTFDVIKKITIEVENELKEGLRSFEQLYRPDEINLHIKDSGVGVIPKDCLKLLAWLHYKNTNNQFLDMKGNGADSFKELNKWHRACEYTLQFSHCIICSEIDEINSLTQFAKLVDCAELKIYSQCNDFVRKGVPQLFDVKLLRFLKTMQRSMLRKIKKISVEHERQLKKSLDNFQRLYEPDEINLNVCSDGTQFSYSLSVFQRSIQVSENFFKLLAWLHYQKMNDEFLHIDSKLNKFLNKQDLPKTFDSNELCSLEGRVKNIFANEFFNEKSRLSFEKYISMQDLTLLFNRVFKIDSPTFCWEYNLKLKAMNSLCIVSETLEECREQLEKEENGLKTQEYQEIKKDFENVRGLLKRALLQSETLEAGNCILYLHESSTSDSESSLSSIESH